MTPPRRAPYGDAFRSLGLEPGLGICYSGYRRGQSPDTEVYPSREQILEDLLLLASRWKYLRLYDCSEHATRTLEVIRTEGLPFRVMLGAYIAAEESNPRCPWGGGVHDERQLARNRRSNREEIERLVDLTNAYPGIVFSASVGNEATVDWTDHLVPVEQVIRYARRVREGTRVPVTFCENYVPWHAKLAALVPELDFLSVHTYPVWEHRTIEDALAYTQENLRGVAERHPGVPLVITEAGWTTHSNGRGIDPRNAHEEAQEAYLHQIETWCARDGIPLFTFEAFDEPWKGSPDPLEPEKHWGLFTEDRKPKRAMQPFYPFLR